MWSKLFTLVSFWSIIFVTGALSSCEQNSSGAESSVEEKASLEKLSRKRPRAVGVWNSPELIGNSVLPNSATGYLHGPVISASNTGNNVVSWRVHTGFNPQTGVYANGTTTVMKESSFAAWQPLSPIPVNQQVSASLPHILVNDSDGNVHATWIYKRAVYSSVQNPVTGWSTPVQLGNGDQVWLVANGSSGVAAVWQYETAFNQFTINVARFQFGNVWSATDSITRDAKFINATQPVMDASGQVLFAWQEETASQRGLYSASYNGFSWSQAISVRAAQPIGAELIIGYQLVNSIFTGQSQLVLQVTDSIFADGIFAYEYAQGFWLSEQNVDRNIGVSDRTQLEPFALAANEMGNILVAWVEQQTDNINNYSLVQAARYVPSLGWDTPQAVSPPIFRGPINAPPTGAIPTYISNLDAVVDSLGEASVSWIENSTSLSELFIAHDGQVSNWGVAQQVVSYVGSDRVENPDLALNGSAPVVTWLQTKRRAQGEMYDIWFARSQSVGGSVITPTPFDPNLPKPINHIPSSEACLECHSVTGVTIVNHAEVVGACVSCHNNFIASGKSAIHIMTSDRCDFCHQTSTWVPVVTVDHREVLGSCQSCHNGVVAQGKGPLHVVSSPQCINCHNTRSWVVVNVFPGPGIITPTTPKPVNHIPSTNSCLNCHVGGSPIVNRVDHTQVIGSCESCHNGIVAPGRPLAHINAATQCDACHATAMWNPVLNLDHMLILGSCSDCHNGIRATGKSSTHIPSSNVCELCHNYVSGWISATNPGAPINSGPIGSWTQPISVWTNSSPANSNDYVHGPELAVETNNLVLSLVKHSRFNGLTGRYDAGENFVYRSSNGAIWNKIMPAPQAEMLNASMVQTAVSPTGRAYALWSKLGELFFSESQSPGAWSAPQSLGQVSGQYHLLTQNDRVVAVWRETLGPNRVVINARSYQAGGIWGANQSFEVGESATFSDPVIDAQGQVYIARQELLSNSSGGLTLFLYYNSYNQLGGWSQDLSLPSLPSQVISPIELNIAAVGQGQLVALAGVVGITGFNDSGLFVYSPSSVSGWQSLLTPSTNLVGKPQLVSNAQGNVIAAWTQADLFGIAGPSYQVFTSSLQPFSSNWSVPTRLGNPTDRFETDPSLTMRPDGEVIATWVGDSSGRSTIYTRHYSFVGGWSTQPQTVVVNDVAINGYTMSPTIGYSLDGRYYLAWKQVLYDQFNSQYSVWVSTSQSLF